MLKYISKQWRISTLALAATASCYAQGALHPLYSENSEVPAPTQETAQQDARPDKVSPALRAKAAGTGMVRVFLALTDQLDRRDLDTIKRRYAAQIGSFDQQARIFRGKDRNSAVEQRAAAGERDKLIHMQRREIAARAKDTYSFQQELIRSRVEGLGGQVIERFTSTNVMYVEVPGTVLSELEREPAIARVFESEFKKLDSVFTDTVLGTATPWNSGVVGGTQRVATIDSGIARENPGFGDLEIETHVQVAGAMRSPCAVEVHVTGDDLYGHGTHVAGIVAGQGAGKLAESVGVAPGLGSLLAIKVGVLGTGKGDCPDLLISTLDVLKALEYAVIDAPTPARVVNLSLGGRTRDDDSPQNWVIDKLVDDYDVTIVVSAGNYGQEPTLYQLGDLAMSYNGITVANVDLHSTLSRGDDTIAASSSNGPTPKGRRKPDIAAPGTKVVSLLPHDESGPMSGTSMAAPHITGAAALLYDAGVTGAKEVKAVLLNSAQGQGWSRRSGWGSADVKAAFLTRNAVASAAVQGGTARYYRVNVDGSMHSTLVWNRHITSITPDLSTAYGDFRDLNLAIYEADTNRSVASSTSKIDNVEQIGVGGTAAAVVKVSHNGDPDAEEPYALAFTTGDFAEVQPARLDLQCDGSSEVAATMPVIVKCRMRNLGQLPVFGVGVKVSAPTGFMYTAIPAIVKLNPDGEQNFVLQMSTPSLARGATLYSVSVAGIAYGDTIGAKVPMAVNIRDPKPQNCNPVIDPASGSVTLSALAQSFVIRMRFPGFDPQEPGVCSWTWFSSGTWYGTTGNRSGTGDTEFIISTSASPSSTIVKTRLASIRLTINRDVSHYTFEQLYGKR